jgi:hypothetical protein
MENNSFTLAASIAVFYAIFKFVEKRFIVKEDIVLKDIVKNTLIVYASTLVGIFVVDQVGDVSAVKTPTSAFTDSPDF